MKKVWITYCWQDNKDQEVDFIAQELRAKGLDVKMDKLDIQTGKRLWDQIDRFISHPEESDAWILYATENSLCSEPCKEEYAYALQRALKTRSESFPIIGLFSTNVVDELIPAGISSRLYVSTIDPDWKERVCSGVEGRKPNIPNDNIAPFVFKIHPKEQILEMRPKAGVWSPFILIFPLNEKNNVSPQIGHGSANNLNSMKNALFNIEFRENKEKNLWVFKADMEATPSRSYYLQYRFMPSFIAFGDANSPTGLYKLELNNDNATKTQQ